MNDKIVNDRKILRKLAYEYFYASHEDENIEKIKLHKAVNDFKMVRPVVLIDEIPWHEMNINDELTLRCEDEYLRQVEWYFRTTLYKYRHFRADTYIQPFVPVNKMIHSTGFGVEVCEKLIPQSSNGGISSHAYTDQLTTEEDVEKLRNPIITYNEEETLKRYNLLGEIIGDIIPVRLSGLGYLYAGVWDEISGLRGATNLLIDLAERPEFMQKIASKMFAAYHSMVDQYEALGLFDSDVGALHCTAIATDDLPKNKDGEKLTAKNVWGRGMAQIFASVSKSMRDEFDIKYMKDLLGRFGLSYYGCCEPLDKMVDIVAQIPNLRKIGVTPWADVNVAAEAIGKKYVVASKPNPASVAVSCLDKDVLRKEIGEILDAVKRNGCSADIVLKDISTCNGRPENIFEWEKTVMEMVNNF